MTDREALKLALEALKKMDKVMKRSPDTDKAINAAEEALAQPEQEHFALKHRIAELEGAVIGLQAQLAQPEQEPVGWFGYDQGTSIWFETNKGEDNSVPLYTTPPQRTWVGLTDEDRQQAFESLPDMLDGFLKKWGWLHFSKAIEARLKEKNT